MRIESCKCGIFLSLVVMVAIILCSTAAMATGYFSGISANPSLATLGTQVTITFAASQLPQYNPTVTVNNHSATYYSRTGSGPYFYTYHYSIQSSDADGAATIYVTAYNFSPDTSTTALTVDKTAPTMNSVTDDGVYTTDDETLHATWSGSDATSGITDYKYAIGTTAGDTDVVGWTSTGTSTSVTKYMTFYSGTTYYFSVKAEDAAGNWSDGLSADGITVDTVGPTMSSVTDDGNYTTSTTTLHATWSGSDTVSGIAEYEYAIGTSAGATNTVGWTSTGTTDSVTKTSLSLSAGQIYYFTVKAQDTVGNWGSPINADGIKCVNLVVSSTTSDTNRAANGLITFPWGEEQWCASTGNITTKFGDLLDRWNTGSIRTDGSMDRFPWDTTICDYALRWGTDMTWMLDATLDQYGHWYGTHGLIDISSRTNAALCWQVNMTGEMDSYTKAVYDDPEYVQQPPSELEKEYWCLLPDDPIYNDHVDDNENLPTYGDYSIYKRTGELAYALSTDYPDEPRIYELGNEVEYGNSCDAPEAYWKTGDGLERVSRGAGYCPHNQLVTPWNGYGYNMTLDWGTGKTGTGEEANILYLGYAYKPSVVEFDMETAGSGGSLVWQYQNDDGDWVNLTPAGAIRWDNGQTVTVCRSDDPATPNINEGVNVDVLDEMINLQLASPSGCWNRIFLLPLPRMTAYEDESEIEVGYTPAEWESNGNHYDDWVRTQPADLVQDGSNVRKLYWLRIYASSAYETSPVESKMTDNWPDYGDWLTTCDAMYDVIKANDEGAQVVNDGLAWIGELGYLADSQTDYGTINISQNRLYWHFLTESPNVDKWDGLNLHAYAPVSSTTELLNATEDAGTGLLKIIDDFRELLDDNDLNDRIIACTEWGANVVGPNVPDGTLCSGLYWLDARLSMLGKRDETRPITDYAMNYCIPGKRNSGCPYYTTPEPQDEEYNPATTEYTQRPTGLALCMIGDHYRALEHDIDNSEGTSAGRAFAFSESGKTSTLVLINKTASQTTKHCAWPAVAGKKVYVCYLKSNQTSVSLNDNNDDPEDLQVVYRGDDNGDYDAGDHIWYQSEVVDSGGYFEVDVPAYSAVGIKFQD